MIEITYVINTEDVDKDGYGDITVESRVSPKTTGNDNTDFQEAVVRMLIDKSVGDILDSYYDALYLNKPNRRAYKKLVDKAMKYFNDKYIQEKELSPWDSPTEEIDENSDDEEGEDSKKEETPKPRKKKNK